MVKQIQIKMICILAWYSIFVDKSDLNSSIRGDFMQYFKHFTSILVDYEWLFILPFSEIEKNICLNQS